jgi:hypothetical protein
MVLLGYNTPVSHCKNYKFRLFFEFRGFYLAVIVSTVETVQEKLLSDLLAPGCVAVDRRKVRIKRNLVQKHVLFSWFFHHLGFCFVLTWSHMGWRL